MTKRNKYRLYQTIIHYYEIHEKFTLILRNPQKSQNEHIVLKKCDIQKSFVYKIIDVLVFISCSGNDVSETFAKQCDSH